MEDAVGQVRKGGKGAEDEIGRTKKGGKGAAKGEEICHVERGYGVTLSVSVRQIILFPKVLVSSWLSTLQDLFMKSHWCSLGWHMKGPKLHMRMVNPPTKNDPI